MFGASECETWRKSVIWIAGMSNRRLLCNTEISSPHGQFISAVLPSACHCITNIVENYRSGSGFEMVHSVHVGHDSSVGIVRRSNPGGGEIFRTHPERFRDPPSLIYNGYWVIPGGKAAGAWR
jgi:hypothetical protein